MIASLLVWSKQICPRISFISHLYNVVPWWNLFFHLTVFIWLVFMAAVSYLTVYGMYSMPSAIQTSGSLFFLLVSIHLPQNELNLLQNKHNCLLYTWYTSSEYWHNSVMQFCPKPWPKQRNFTYHTQNKLKTWQANNMQPMVK